MTHNLFHRALSRVSDKTRERVREWCDKIDEMEKREIKLPMKNTKKETKKIPVKLTGIASHLEGYERVKKGLELDKIPFPCEAFPTGKCCELGHPIVYIPSVGKDYSLYWIEHTN